MQTEINKGSEDGMLLDLLDDMLIDEDNATPSVEESDDLLDLLEADNVESVAEDLSEVSSLPVFTEDYMDNSVPSVMLDYEIKPEEDAIRFDIEDSEEDEDFELIKELQGFLKEAGYRHVDLYDYEQLVELKRLEEVYASDDVLSEQRELLIKQFYKIQKYIMSSKATLLKTKPSLKNSDLAMPDLPANLDKGFAGIVWDTICSIVMTCSANHENVREKVTPNAITVALFESNLPSEYKRYVDNENYFLFLQNAIPIAISVYQSSIDSIQEVERQRQKVATYLLKREEASIKLLESGEYQYIKQIFRTNGEYFYYCSECNEVLKIDNSFISYVLFAEERSDFDASVIPRIIKCPNCGRHHLLPLEHYVTIAKHLGKVYAKGAGEVFKFLSKVSTGTSITKISPDIETLMESIKIVVDANLDAKVLTTASDKTEDAKELVYDDVEYAAAIKAFYNKLLLFSDNSNEVEEVNLSLFNDLDSMEMQTVQDVQLDHLSPKELAKCLTSELSMNYQLVKNKALYSLLMSLNEFKYFSSSLDRTILWDMENRHKILQRVDSMNSNDKELISFCRTIYNELFNHDCEDLEILRKSLLEYDNSLLESIKEFHSNYEKTFATLKSNLDLFSHTKILNINQVSYTLLERYLNDGELATVLDEITDKMIINNYAEKYSSVLFNSSILNGTRLRATLLLIAEGHKIASEVNNICEKKCYITLPSIILDRLEYITANHLTSLRDAADALKSYDYYHFVTALSSLDDCATLISPAADKSLEEAVALAKQRYSELQSEQSDYNLFYLKDFTKTDIEDLTPASRAELGRLTFGQFTPKRLDNESLEDYIKRYKTLSRTNTFSTCECYDNVELFEEFEPYYAVIFAGYNVLDLDSDNFALANFARCWLLLCYSDFSRAAGLRFLGYNEAYFNRLNRLTNYEFDAESFKDTASVYRVLHGHYLTVCDELLFPFSKHLDKLSFSERDNINHLGGYTVNQFVDEIDQLNESDLIAAERKHQTIGNPQNQDDTVEVEDADTIRENAKNEILLFTEGVYV